MVERKNKRIEFMLKYSNYAVTFSEIPDEICLYITLTGCLIHCPECNSKWLWEDTGKNLDCTELERLINENKGITCVVFGGGDGNIKSLWNLLYYLRTHHETLKTAFYSGSKNIIGYLINYLDYYKIGPFDSKYGPLNNPMTNQRLYKIEHKNSNYIDSTTLIDITYKFWKNNESKNI